MLDIGEEGRYQCGAGRAGFERLGLTDVLAARRVEEGLELEQQRRGPQFVIRQVLRS